MRSTPLVDWPIILDSGKPGPCLLIIGGIHGDEPCGINAIQAIVQDPEAYRPTHGKMMLMYGNPQAIKKGVRYIDENLNRIFMKSKENLPDKLLCLEKQRMQQLKLYMDKADILLDIHASYTQKSKPFVICEPNAMQLVPFLPCDIVCFGFDSIQPGGTDWYMNSIGKIGICVECGYLGAQSSTAVAMNACKSILGALEMSVNRGTRRKQEWYQATQQYCARTDNFQLVRAYADFENIPKGTPFAKDGDQTLYATEGMYLLFARNTQEKGQEAFLSLVRITPPPPPPHTSPY